MKRSVRRRQFKMLLSRQEHGMLEWLMFWSGLNASDWLRSQIRAEFKRASLEIRKERA